MSQEIPLFEELDPRCNGCSHSQEDENICKIYFKPMAWFRAGGICPMATHLSSPEETPLGEKFRIGQQKGRRKKK